LVVQVIVAPLLVSAELDTPEMTGAVVSGAAGVVNVKSADVARFPAASRLFTRKWYVVDGCRPLSVAECDVTFDVLSVVVDPYDVLVPYSTCVSDASSVVHDTVPPLLVSPDDPTPEIVGAVVSGAAAVVNVKSADVVKLPAASRLSTR